MLKSIFHVVVKCSIRMNLRHISNRNGKKENVEKRMKFWWTRIVCVCVCVYTVKWKHKMENVEMKTHTQTPDSYSLRVQIKRNKPNNG